MNMNDKDVSSILREQYASIETFCNATTCLHNALLVQKQADQHLKLQHDDLYQTTLEYQEALINVQSNLRRLESMTQHDSNNPLHRSLRAHVARTRRILTTIYTSGQGASFHPNGLPTPTTSTSTTSSSTTNATRLVALAALRASIETVTEHLSTPS